MNPTSSDQLADATAPTVPLHSAHRMFFGTEIRTDGVRFRLFAPALRELRLQLQDAAEPLAMQALGGGWFELVLQDARPGLHYSYLLPDGTAVPDPASRYQPDDVEGASEIIDPASFAWTDGEWRGRPWAETVLYELHVGTFTPEGTFLAAAARLNHLQSIGITGIELMCVADFAGARNWGYDSVLLYAPDSRYGRPEDLKAFIDAAHARGIQVILDVVYNHFGPQGNSIPKYFPQMLTNRHCTPWGDALNFDESEDGDCARQVREFIIHNALYWIEEFHIDGLRLDAAHAIIDDGPIHVLDELAGRVRELAAANNGGPPRQVHLIREDEHNVAGELLRDENGGCRGFTAQWNHDMTHLLGAAMRSVFPTKGVADENTPGENAPDDETVRLSRALAEGFVLAASESDNGDEIRCKVPPTAFISFLQTHDLIGNRIAGERIHALAPVEAVRAATSVLLLAPQIPMIFMGDEWGATSPFPYFCDFADGLGESVRTGRCEFLKKLHNPSEEELRNAPNPQAESTFISAKLNWDERAQPTHAAWLAWYPRILEVRLNRIAPLLAHLSGRCGHSRVIAPGAFQTSWKLRDGDLLLKANLRPEPRGGFDTASGEVIWTEGSEVNGAELGSWSVQWSIRVH